MQDQKNKMEKSDWFILQLTAGFFDFCGLVCLPLDLILGGWAGWILNIFAGLTFLLWALIWSDKGLGMKFLATFLIGFSVEGSMPILIPYIGGLIIPILPTWWMAVLRAKSNYEKGNSLVGAVTGKVTNSMTKMPASSGMTPREKFLATQASGRSMNPVNA